jgi:hypothetical protein
MAGARPVDWVRGDPLWWLERAPDGQADHELYGDFCYIYKQNGDRTIAICVPINTANQYWAVALGARDGYMWRCVSCTFGTSYFNDTHEFLRHFYRHLKQGHCISARAIQYVLREAVYVEEAWRAEKAGLASHLWR